MEAYGVENGAGCGYYQYSTTMVESVLQKPNFLQSARNKRLFGNVDTRCACGTIVGIGETDNNNKP
jgi:hypothetical protein